MLDKRLPAETFCVILLFASLGRKQEIADSLVATQVDSLSGKQKKWTSLYSGKLFHGRVLFGIKMGP